MSSVRDDRTLGTLPVVKRRRDVSQMMVGILAAASQAEAGVSVRELVAGARRAGRSQPVARASVSRALRRLWRQGAVELHSRRVGAGGTMSDQRQRAREMVSAARANPEQFYKNALSFRAHFRKDNCDPYGSADACVSAKEREAAKMPRLRAVRVTVTDAGRALLVQRLKIPPAVQLTGLPMTATTSEAAE